MKKTIAIITAILIAAALLAGCSGAVTATVTPAPSVQPSASVSASETPASSAAQKTDVSVAALIGPTGMGLAPLMEKQYNNAAENNYTFTLSGTPDAIVAKITSGEADIAAVPVNLAPTLYNKTGGKVQLLAINTLGVLYVVERGDAVHSVADLAGKTLYASGQAATPEYILNFILSQNGLDPAKDLTVEYKADHSELASLVTAGQSDLAMLPEPFVTTVTQKDPDLRIALDLTKQWDKIEGNGGSALIMGVMIVRSDFAEQNPEALAKFMDEYKASTEFVNNNISESAALIEGYGIMPSAALAEQAIPNCNIVYIDGQQMKNQIMPFYQILFDSNPKSIGGTLPDDAFYYTRQ